MASTDNTALKKLNLKMFELMEDVKEAIDTQEGKKTFFYQFRGNSYRGSRSIKDGFFFPGQESPYVSPYVVLQYTNGNGHYQVHITKDNNGNYSSDIGFYKDALKNKNTDFASYGFIVDQQKTYIVKDENWVNFKQKMIKFFSDYKQLFDFSSQKVRNNYEKNIDTINKIVSKTVTSDNTINDTPVSPKGNVNDPLNQILYGPPGTGKTYNTVNKALKIILGETAYSDLAKKAENQQDPKDKRQVFTDVFKRLQKIGQIVFTTFHQSMSYEDFVEGIKPIPKDGKLNYEVQPGIFKQICDEAKNANNKDSDICNVEIEEEEKPFYNYVLIIDEINRGNVSQIFGELITLIEDDKRLGKPEALTAKLPYSHDDFGVPQNLYIIGTMNTADRSVEALDTALRRRFSFEEIMPKYDATGMDREICGKKLCDILWTINQRIEVLKGREQQIGHSYLMKCKDDKDLKNAFKDKIVPLLQEYFYGDYSQIGLVLGSGFIQKDYSSNIKFPQDFDSPDLNEIYHLLTDKEWEEIEAKELTAALDKMKISEWPEPNSVKREYRKEGVAQMQNEDIITENNQ